jgi:hypothetical protein
MRPLHTTSTKMGLWSAHPSKSRHGQITACDVMNILDGACDGLTCHWSSPVCTWQAEGHRPISCQAAHAPTHTQGDLRAHGMQNWSVSSRFTQSSQGNVLEDVHVRWVQRAHMRPLLHVPPEERACTKKHSYTLSHNLYGPQMNNDDRTGYFCALKCARTS